MSDAPRSKSMSQVDIHRLWQERIHKEAHHESNIREFSLNMQELRPITVKPNHYDPRKIDQHHGATESTRKEYESMKKTIVAHHERPKSAVRSAARFTVRSESQEIGRLLQRPKSANQAYRRSRRISHGHKGCEITNYSESFVKSRLVSPYSKYAMNGAIKPSDK